MFGERAADLYETGKIFIKKNTQSECITILKQWEARKLGPRLSQNSVFTPQLASGYTVSEGPTGSKPSFQTVWVSHPTLSERAAGASESCFKIVIPSDYLCNFFRHFTQIFALFPDANLAHCRFGYFLMVLAGL